MKDKINNLLAALEANDPWQYTAIIAIKVLGYGLLAIVTAIEEKK